MFSSKRGMLLRVRWSRYRFHVKSYCIPQCYNLNIVILLQLLNLYQNAIYQFIPYTELW